MYKKNMFNKHAYVRFTIQHNGFNAIKRLPVPVDGKYCVILSFACWCVRTYFYKILYTLFDFVVVVLLISKYFCLCSWF